LSSPFTPFLFPISTSNLATHKQAKKTKSSVTKWKEKTHAHTHTQPKRQKKNNNNKNKEAKVTLVKQLAREY
jgi:hypothetical protein